MTVLTFPHHRLFRCEVDRAPDERDRCHEGLCHYCSGGLSYCKTCGGAEASLPSQCPGEPMTDDQEAQVMAGKLDYSLQRGWHHPSEAWVKTRRL